MKTKTKKLTYLTIGLMGALATSTVIGTALSACTITATGSSSDSNITLPDTWYSKDINWDDATSRNNLLIDSQGIVYSNKYMTEIIAIAPGYGGSTITIPASVKSITGYNRVTTSTSGTTTTTKTPTGAFEGLTSLTNVVFAGKNITQIGGAAFKGCTNLQTINLPSSVNLIGDSAFANCSSLSSINLNNVQYIGASAFSSAFTNIPYGSIELDLSQTSFIGASAFSGVTGVNNFNLSKNTSLTSIGASAFANCTYWTGIVDLSSDNYLSSIGNLAFSGCTSITNIYISDVTPLKTIGNSAFSGCTKLASIGTSTVTSGFILPRTVTSIGTTAFANTLISSIDMSQMTATNPLATSAFKDMTELTSIDLGTHITTLPALLFQNTPKLSEFDLVVPASVSSIQAEANGTGVGTSGFVQSTYSTFERSGFRSIDLSKSSITLNNLGYCFFQDCTNLQTVKLKTTITALRFRTFYNCTALKNVIFVNTSNNSPIAEEGFVAPSTLTELGPYAFYNSGIESVDLSAVTANIMGAENNATGNNANNYRFANCASLTSVKLPASTTTIPGYNFANNPKLESFNFSDLTSLTTISANNFNGSNFSSIDLSSNTRLSQTTLNNLNLFTNLLKNAEVKLPSTATTVRNTNFTYLRENEGGTTTTTNLNLQYPNGLGASSTSYDNKILSSSNSSSFGYMTRISGDLNFSNFTNLQGLGQNTLFGNTALTSLTFGAKTFAAGLFNQTTSSSKYTYLGFIGTGITAANADTSQNPSTYATANLPFGNMSSLNAINFNNFTNAAASDDSTDTNQSVMAKTTSDTWDEVARIINSFAKSSVTENDSSRSVVANLSSWEPLASNVTSQVTYSEATNGGSQIVQSVTLTSGNNTVTISDSSTSGSIEYQGVTWSINLDSENSTITITSDATVDTYRAVVASGSGTSATYPGPGYKVFFNTKSTTAEGTTTTTISPNSNITITLNVVSS